MNKFALTLAPLMIATSAFALDNPTGLFVEPMITYEVGEARIAYPAPFGKSTGDTDGLGIGARLGFHVWETLFVGVDARYAKLNIENSTPKYSSDTTSYNYGPVIGLQLPTLFALRVWAGYILDGEIDFERDNDVDLKLKDGEGYRVGVGVKLALVSLNLEYQDIDYDKVNVADAGIFSGSRTGLAADNQSYVFSVSFPFSI